MFRSQTYGEIPIESVPDKMLMFKKNNEHIGSDFYIVVGTDSMTTDKTKVVTVISILCRGHGGIFFSESVVKSKIQSLQEKLQYETTRSLEIVTTLVNVMESDSKYSELLNDCPISVHIDAGNTEKNATRSVVKGLVGWVEACGYSCEIKPESFAASSIADKLSK